MAKSNEGKETRTRIGPKLLEYLDKHTGETVYRDSVATDLGITTVQAAQNMYGLWYRDVNGAKTSLEIIIPGNAWRWRPKSTDEGKTAKPAKRVFEELAITKAGELLIQDEAGTVYIAKEL